MYCLGMGVMAVQRTLTLQLLVVTALSFVLG